MPAMHSDGNDAAAPAPARWAAPVLVLFAAVLSALPPLHETDLAQHLATGEWIFRERAVPFTEPFAWTREGQPYFAYSWFAQVLYYVLLRATGPLGLHLLEGALAAAAVGSMLWAARQFGWPPIVRLAVAALHLALLWGVANTIRPQQFLFVTVPLAWGLAAAIRRGGLSARRLAGFAAVGCLAANTHLFFPLTAVPIAYLLATDARTRTWLAAGGALVVGWLVSPYGTAWPQVFALNFGHNVLLGRPPSIAEFVPGFEYARARPGVIVTGAALLLAPWLAGRHAIGARARIADVCFWTLGLLLFAYAGRLIFAWWTLALPQVGGAAERVAVAAAATVRRTGARLVVAAGAVLALVAAAPPISPAFWFFEGDTEQRMLPRAGEDPALWLPSWLLCHTRPGATGRLFTEFNYGSELTWRLPGYSPSIDGRTIFPDSIAIDFSMYPYGRQRTHAATWQSADVALFDRSLWLAPVLDRHPDWVLLAQSRPTARGTVGALWAKRAWWQRWGTTDAPPADDVHVGDPRATCTAAGIFPR